MQKIILAAAITGLTVASCMHRSSDNFFSDHGRKSTISVNNGFNNLKIEYAGEVTFTDDEKGIAGISNEGYVKFKHNRKKLFAESDGHGGVRYELYNGMSRVNVNGDGRDFIAEAVRTMINHGIDAKGRVARLYQKGGTAAVLNKVDEVESAYVKQIYLDFLLSNSTLSVNEKMIVAQSIASIDGADYEKSQLLEKYAGQFNNAELNQAFLVAVKSINGNYEKSKVLQAAVKEMAPGQSAKGMLIASKSINANYEKSNVLKTLLESPAKLDDESIPVLVEVVSGIDAGYEKSEVIKSLLSRSELSAPVIEACIKITSTINGNYEKAELLKMIAHKPLTDNNTWIRLIQAAAQIDANYEKSNVLIAIAAGMPTDSAVKEAYLSAAKTIESEYEYGETMKAIR
jgi:hypothetical protein